MGRLSRNERGYPSTKDPPAAEHNQTSLNNSGGMVQSRDRDGDASECEGEPGIGLVCAACKKSRVAGSPRCCGGDGFVELGTITKDSISGRAVIAIPGTQPWSGYDDERLQTAGSSDGVDGSIRVPDQIAELNQRLRHKCAFVWKVPRFCEDLRD